MEPFRQLLEGLRDAAQHMMAANEAIVRAAEGALLAKEEHEDLRETVTRLEHLVMEQGVEMRGLRADVQALRKERNGS